MNRILDVFHVWTKLPHDMRMHLIGHWLPLPSILNLRATSRQMKIEQDDAFATGTFKSFGFDAYTYHSVEETEGVMAIGVVLRSFKLVLKGLPPGSSSLHAMCINDKPAIVQLLVRQKGTDVNVLDNDGRAPIHLAAIHGHAGVVKLLLAHEGVEANLGNVQGRSPLHLAASKGHAEVVKLLLAHEGVKANLGTVEGYTPLNVAAHNGHAGVVKLLLAHEGVEVNLAGVEGYTPLHLAALDHAAEAVKLLLARRGWERV